MLQLPASYPIPVEQRSKRKEYLLPIIVDQLIKTNRASVKVLETTDKWFGVTYPEDKQIVQDSINELIEQGTYPEKLWK